MTTPIFLLVASSLLGCGKAISDRGFATASAMSDLEHYCFPRSGGPFSANGVWPSVTMMYSGTTLLTTPTMISICGTTPTVAPGLPIDGTVRSAGSTATSSTSGASPDSNISKSVAGSAAASPGPGFSLDASLQSSLASAASLNTLTTGSVLETSSRAVPATPTPDADGGNGSAISSGTVAVSGSATALSGIGQSINASTLPTPPIGSGTLTVSGSATTLSGIGQSINASTLPTPPIGSGTVTASGSATDLSSSGQSVNVPALLTPPISTNTGFGGPSAAVSVTTTDSRFPLGSDMAAISSGNYALTQTGVESKSTLAAGTQASASGGLAGPTGATPGADATQQNGTISLSSPAVDALQLALFMKNLGAAVFNTSRVLLTRSGREKRDTALLVKLVSDISVQEKAQTKMLRSLLYRSGGQDVPSCQYLLPSNVTQLRWLMGALKSINLGVLMSMAESLPPTDSTATIVLSSIASVDAKHVALLQAYTQSNASEQAFDTPASETWAYNFALEYVQPGSCSLELPLPILPKLTMNDKTIGYVQPDTNVTVEWDTAARSAASRSGKPLFIAWVNQVNLPVFTSLTELSEGSGSTIVPQGLLGTTFAVLTAQKLTTIGDLTEVTLAGPVVVSPWP